LLGLNRFRLPKPRIMLQSYKRIAPGKSLDTLNVAQETNPTKTNPTKRKLIDDSIQKTQTKSTQPPLTIQPQVVCDFSIKKEEEFDFNADDSSTTSKSDNYLDADHHITYRVGGLLHIYDLVEQKTEIMSSP